MAWHDLTGAGVSHRHSEVESRRFGLTVGRLTIGSQVAETEDSRNRVAAAMAAADEDVLVVRYPGSALGWAGVLAGAGRTLLPAGSLTYWEVPSAALAATGPSAAGKDLRVTGADDIPGESRAAALETVTAVVRDSFAGYGNHYAANPLLSSEAALEGYVEWAGGALDGTGQDVLFLWEGQAPVGVATLAESPDGADLEILLAGLVGAAQGRGWYGELLRAVGLAAQARGRPRVIISTQTHNVRVQRAWVRAGLRPFATVETVHAVRQGLLANR